MQVPIILSAVSNVPLMNNNQIHQLLDIQDSLITVIDSRFEADLRIFKIWLVVAVIILVIQCIKVYVQFRRHTHEYCLENVNRIPGLLRRSKHNDALVDTMLNQEMKKDWRNGDVNDIKKCVVAWNNGWGFAKTPLEEKYRSAIKAANAYYKCDFDPKITKTT